MFPLNVTKHQFTARVMCQNYCFAQLFLTSGPVSKNLSGPQRQAWIPFDWKWISWSFIQSYFFFKNDVHKVTNALP